MASSKPLLPLLLLLVLQLLLPQSAAQATSPAQLKVAAKALKEGINDFTQSFYLHMAGQQPKGNFVFSPLSMHSALATLYLGTKYWSETSEELSQAMGVINNRQSLKLGYREIIKTYQNQTNFLYANKFWVQKGFPVSEKFSNAVRDNMNYQKESIDFDMSDSEAKVNAWISTATGGKITKLIDSFSADTQLFLANALYFKESWLVPFEDSDQGRRVTAPFLTGRGANVTVPMIYQKSSLVTYQLLDRNLIGQDVEVITVPYDNDLFELQIILPKTPKEMDLLESKMVKTQEMDLQHNDRGFFNLFSASHVEPEEYIDDVLLKMPTFKIKTDLDAGDPLMKLGVKKVFTSRAELDEIAEGGGLAVSRIKHTSVIEVTKEGTEGAAATGVEIALFSANFGKQQDVTVDRPFIFIVIDRQNGIPVLGCQCKIQNHCGATTQQVAAALEFSVAKLPSLICSSLGAPLYLGGFKAAVNVSWLQEAAVSLVVDTAGGLGATLGPGYTRAVARRDADCPGVRILQLNLRDDNSQKLEEEVLRSTAREVLGELARGAAVLVHCAQGRSRSTAVVLAVLCWGLKITVETALKLVQGKRAMAQPNEGFMEQLLKLERDGVFLRE